MIGKLLFDKFTNISTAADNRIFPNIGPIDAEMPFVVYDVVDVEPTPTKDRPDSELDTYTVNITALATSLDQATKVITDFIAHLDDIPKNSTVAGLKFQSGYLQSRGDDYNDDLEAYMSTAQYKFRILP